MSDFQLPDDQERIRATLFPNKTPAEFASMRERHHSQYAAMPAESQERIKMLVDEMGQDLATSYRRYTITKSKFLAGRTILETKRAMRKARGK